MDRKSAKVKNNLADRKKKRKSPNPYLRERDHDTSHASTSAETQEQTARGSSDKSEFRVLHFGIHISFYSDFEHCYLQRLL